MKILIDMNLSPVWVEFFLKNNIEAVHWVNVGKPNDPDKVIFDYASTNNYIVFTNDLDFGAILAATNANAPSVFQLKSQNLLPDVIGETVINCLNQYENYLKEGSLITFDSNKTRVRILPLK
jgi:predicted nuclease of predicted toxin-antitoxin system